jgi:hypothetical protein
MGAVLVDLGAVPVAAQQVVAVLAEEAPPPGKGEEFGKASPIGLVVVLLLAVATVFLIRSMSKRIRRLPASFDPPPDQPTEPDPPAGTADGRAAQPTGRDAEDAGDGRA